MRITGGRWRSRKLTGPGKNMPLRPTPDSLRERAFAIFGARIEGARFLDLFAGTGSVGLEALSRGADCAVFVDHHPAATSIIRRNVEQLDDAGMRSRIMTRPAIKAVAELARRKDRFDFIWADPPFEIWNEGAEALAAAWSTGLLHDDGLALLECPARADVKTLPAILVVRRDLVGGASRLLMLDARIE